MARDQRDNEESDCIAASTFAESYIRHNVGTNKKFAPPIRASKAFTIDLNLKKGFRNSGQSLRSTT